MNKFHYRIWAVGIAAVIILLLFNHYDLWSFLSLKGFNRYHQQILSLERQYVVKFTIVYVISYIILITLGIPGTIVFDLLAGFIYGPYLGSFWVIFSYLIGAVMNYCLVRLLFKEAFQQKFAHLRHIIFRGGGMRRAAMNLIGLRFIPVVPFWLLNILAAILDIPLVIFIFTTFIGIIPTSIIYVLIGDSVRDQLLHNQQLSAEIFTDPTLWVPLVLLALLILIPNIYKSIKQRPNK